MTKYVWYFMITNELMETIEKIKADFPCFVKTEIVEMNWIELTIDAREEDIDAIERRLAPHA